MPPSPGGVGASGELFGKQLAAVLIAAVYSYVVSILILMAIGCVCRLKPTAVEIVDMDHSQHGEAAYLDALENDSKYTWRPNLKPDP